MRPALTRRLLPILAAFGLLGALHSVVVPLFEAPDELWHFSFVRYLATERALPVHAADGSDIWLRESGQPPLYYLLAAPLVAPLDTGDFPAFVRFNVAHPAITATSTSDAPNVFIHTPHERFPYRGAVLAVHLVRLLTVLWGIGTLSAAYLLAREVLPARPDLWAAVVALVAFNPHFIYINSVVNNDGAAAALATATLWLAVRLLRHPSSRWTAALGGTLGLALLGKLSALALLPLTGLALLLRWRRDRDTAALARRGAVIYGLALLVGGWWYGRNYLLYGDPLAWRVWLAAAGARPSGLVSLARQFRQVGLSFWSPYPDLFPAWVSALLGLATVLAVGGWLRLMGRLRRGAPLPFDSDGLLLCAVWFALLAASLIRYMSLTPAATGRLLFPGLAAFALLLTLGWDALLPRRRSARVLTVVGVGLLALSVYSPLGAIGPRYALPLADEDELAAATPLSALEADGVRPVAVQVAPSEARRGDEVTVTLYWSATLTPTGDLRAVTRLWTLGGRLVGQSDRVPAGETYPPDLWRPGDLVRDRRRVRVDAVGPALCRVTVSLLVAGEPVGEVSSPPLLRLDGEPLPADGYLIPQTYTLGEAVELIGCDLRPVAEGLRLGLYWRPRARMEEDYTVFVHLLDSAGEIAAQGDGPPLGGDYPTSAWLPGEVVADYHVIPAAMPKGGRLLVGLYRPADGARLPVYTAEGERVPEDAVPLPCGR